MARQPMVRTWMSNASSEFLILLLCYVLEFGRGILEILKKLVSRRSKEHATEKKGRVSQFKLSLEIVVDLLVGRRLITTMDNGQTGERKGPTVGEASLLSQGAPSDENVQKGGGLRRPGRRREVVAYGDTRVPMSSSLLCFREFMRLLYQRLTGPTNDGTTIQRSAEILGGLRHRDRAGSVTNRCCYVIGQAYWAFVLLRFDLAIIVILFSMT
ncbi:hypothetical protein ALC53_07442 [Atta colombica]|uniref:Uncharacterized protein n=1 Tax=Atta colombica TaxID=520822 RepID=A0A151I312_9HYME|nr:hypothetical protein ALC53_07442 [Atta colombica]